MSVSERVDALARFKAEFKLTNDERCRELLALFDWNMEMARDSYLQIEDAATLAEFIAPMARLAGADDAPGGMGEAPDDFDNDDDDDNDDGAVNDEERWEALTPEMLAESELQAEVERRTAAAKKAAAERAEAERAAAAEAAGRKRKEPMVVEVNDDDDDNFDEVDEDLTGGSSKRSSSAHRTRLAFRDGGDVDVDSNGGGDDDDNEVVVVRNAIVRSSPSPSGSAKRGLAERNGGRGVTASLSLSARGAFNTQSREKMLKTSKEKPKSSAPKGGNDAGKLVAAEPAAKRGRGRPSKTGKARSAQDKDIEAFLREPSDGSFEAAFIARTEAAKKEEATKRAVAKEAVVQATAAAKEAAAKEAATANVVAAAAKEVVVRDVVSSMCAAMDTPSSVFAGGIKVFSAIGVGRAAYVDWLAIDGAANCLVRCSVRGEMEALGRTLQVDGLVDARVIGELQARRALVVTMVPFSERISDDVWRDGFVFRFWVSVAANRSADAETERLLRLLDTMFHKCECANPLHVQTAETK